MKHELWDHQAEALYRLKGAVIDGKRRPMFQAPTGMGKTIVAAHMVGGALGKGKKIMFVVPAIELVDQTMLAFHDEGITDIGIIQADHPMTRYSAPVQIASVQTLLRRGVPNVDVAIIDEAHRWFKFYEEWFAYQEWQDRPIIGLSATPWTRGLGKFYDDLIIGTTTKELIEKGFLSPFKVFAPSKPDLTGVRTVAGDYHEGDLAKLVAGQKALTGDVVKTWLEKAEGRPTLAFCINRAHAEVLTKEFTVAGVQCGYMDCFTDSSDRRQIKKDFHNGNLKVVCNVGVLTTGVDWDVRCISFCRPTKSEMLYVQIIGRGLRTAPGKDYCLILDHSDNTERLGFVTDIVYPTLDDGKPKAKREKAERKESMPKACTACTFIKPPRTHTCPACGFTPKPPNVAYEAGELREADGDSRRTAYSMLRYIQMERGRKPGWVAYTFKEMFGSWPPRWMELLPPIEPSDKIAKWVKSRDIAWSKRRAA